MPESLEQESKKQKIAAVTIGIAVLAAIGGFIFQNQKAQEVKTEEPQKVEDKKEEEKEIKTEEPQKTEEKKEEAKTEQKTSQTTPQPKTTTTPQIVAYKNGTYSTSVEYTSPAGKETIDVSITLEKNYIQKATFKGNAINPGSQFAQKNFETGYSKVVVGKALENLKLDVVNGASLTSKAFNEALEKIKKQAI